MTQEEILIIKNISREGPGLLEELLKEEHIKYKILDLDLSQELPFPQQYKAVVVLGGPDSANDKTEKMQKELKFVKAILDKEIPYLGICLGLQVMVKAGGGNVLESPLKEIGLFDPEGNNFMVELTEEGKKDSLFEDLENPFKVFHLHGETVELADNMQLLGKGRFCKNQIVKVGSAAYGLQCHFELTPEMFEHWLNEDTDLLKLNNKQLKISFQKIQKNYTMIGKGLFKNFLKIAGFNRI